MKITDEVYIKYAQTVYKFLLSLTRDEDLAQELTQETFYQAVKSIENFDESCSLSSWLCSIAKNRLAAYRRKHPQTYDIDLYDENSYSAEEEALSSLGKIELLKKLHSCPEPYREVMYLRVFGDLSFKEIGEIMSKTENWARVTFYRGKEMIRKEQEENG